MNFMQKEFNFYLTKSTELTDGFDLVTAVPNWIAAFAALATLLVACFGITSWRKTIKTERKLKQIDSLLTYAHMSNCLISMYIGLITSIQMDGSGQRFESFKRNQLIMNQIPGFISKLEDSMEGLTLCIIRSDFFLKGRNLDLHESCMSLYKIQYELRKILIFLLYSREANIEIPDDIHKALDDLDSFSLTNKESFKKILDYLEDEKKKLIK